MRSYTRQQHYRLSHIRKYQLLPSVQSKYDGKREREKEKERDAENRKHGGLEAELGAAPVAALSVVADGVVGSHTDPVRDRPVLPLLLRQFLLDHETLVRRLQIQQVTHTNSIPLRKMNRG